MLSILGIIVVLVVLPCCFLYLIYNPPNVIFTYFRKRWPDVLWCIPTKRKIIALTIDDGPSEYTSEILAVLKANSTNATFFIIGSHIQGREQVLQELVQAGCELGNHAMYDEAARSLPLDTLRWQIDETQAMIDQVYTNITPGEQAPKLFRPGHGFFGTKMRTMLSSKGFRLVLGNVYPHDPQISFWKVNAWHILNMVQPGAIIICHDGRSWTIPMLKTVLPELRRRGYVIFTITQLLQEASLSI